MQEVAGALQKYIAYGGDAAKATESLALSEAMADVGASNMSSTMEFGMMTLKNYGDRAGDLTDIFDLQTKAQRELGKGFDEVSGANVFDYSDCLKFRGFAKRYVWRCYVSRNFDRT